ncbi:aminodeoxychorismate synthase, component I [Iodidimonas gelatinilytica]|uniref:Probable branched-chain-amino-acid aminotransferase n=1 Tax=Iodidimonas gelatinilytica TaxID=1236966 RepID=A0A5A7MVB0_9PROT|nr:aminodeoxychorismate synthase component I [Iodidimonas gelatinilytica]GEQ99514.1 aminodeoxychorismate synthase, component I [Iodidimonas gelatinilytica]
MPLRHPPFVFLDNPTAPMGAPVARLFSNPLKILCAQTWDEVPATLESADAALASEQYLAGWIAYEAAACFEPRLKAAIHSLPEEPLIWLGVFGPPQQMDQAECEAAFIKAQGGSARRARISARRIGEDPARYAQQLGRIQEALTAGDVYQVNHIFPLDLDIEGDPLALYQRLRRSQPVEFGAFIDTGERKILSCSPELFVRSTNGHLEARPMKGTARRGLGPEQDADQANRLVSDEKSRAENLMIVDLLRNDLTRIAEPGSVSVPTLFDVERYPSLLQMTSTITATRRADARFSHIVRALMPCGSITGAPKIRAMELIAQTEPHPRGVYTGAIGWAAPNGDLCFNVAIRTLVEQTSGAFRFGIGSGIVADSNTDAEYDECLLKARFLEDEPDDFALIETLLWTAEKGFPYLSRHMARLAESARHFGFPFDDTALKAALHETVINCDGSKRIRLLLGASGQISVTATPYEAWPAPVRLVLADSILPSLHRFSRHKTTCRERYEAPLAAAKRAHAADEVLFLNEYGHLCEGSRSTLFVQKKGQLFTPPLSDGPLPGVLRAHMLASGQAVEAHLKTSDLEECDAIFVGNAVRGLGRAEFYPHIPITN